MHMTARVLALVGFGLTACGTSAVGASGGDGVTTGGSAAASAPPGGGSAPLARAPASAAPALSTSASSANACASDADCVLVHEDFCCQPSSCDEDLSAMTAAALREKHDICARKDCYAPKRRTCTAKDRRVVAGCRDGACVVVVP